MNKYLKAFKWDGSLATLKRNMTKYEIKAHVNYIRVLDQAVVLKNDYHQRTVHTGNIIVQLPSYDWDYCKPSDFKANWTKAE